MSERKEQVRVLLLLLGVCLFAGLYAWGGIEYKALRRVLGSLVVTLIIAWQSRDWRVLIQWPLFFATLTLPYGADSTAMKVGLRLLQGLANGGSSATALWLHKRWLLGALHVGVLTIVCVVLGVFNPLGSARAEETVIGAVMVLLPILAWSKRNAN